MSVALVQHRVAQIGFASSGSLSFSSTVTAGNFVVVCLALVNTNPSQISSVVDNQSGNTYNLGPEDTNTGFRGLVMYYAMNVAASGTFTVTYNLATSSIVALAISEFSGIATTSALDKTSSVNAAFGSSWSSGTTATLAQADELVVGAATDNGSSNFGTITPGTGFTQIENLTSSPYIFTEWQETAATTGIAATWTDTANDTYSAIVATFKVGGAPPPATASYLPLLGVGS